MITVFVFLAAGVAGTFIGGPLADRFGHKKIILFSLGLSCPLFVLFLLSSGVWSFIWLTLAGLILIFSFSVSMVMGQSFMPQNVGLASGLILGLSFGMGGVGAAVLGLFADLWGSAESMRLTAEDDPVLKKATQLFPNAEALMAKAAELVAARSDH